VHSIGGGHRGRFYTPGIWRDTARVVREIRCDVLHAFWAYEPGLIAGWFSPQLPVITSLGGGELIYLPEIRYGLMGKSWRRSAIRWALGRARVVTAGSPFLMEWAQNLLSPRSLQLVPLGVELSRWTCTPHDVHPPVVLNVGSLEPVKGHQLLLKAFAQVLEDIGSARLRIAGDGMESGTLRRLAGDLGIAEKVEFVGAIPHPQMSGIYAGASLFVQASWHEAQGMATMEAAASGLPIVGTAVGALAALAPDAALSTPVGDAQSLALGIRQLLNDPDKAAHLGRKARAKVESNYSLDATVAGFLRLYESVTG
jgi:glycosyltransferase involved in cell wall biosynthesis